MCNNSRRCTIDLSRIETEWTTRLDAQGSRTLYEWSPRPTADYRGTVCELSIVKLARRAAERERKRERTCHLPSTFRKINRGSVGKKRRRNGRQWAGQTRLIWEEIGRPTPLTPLSLRSECYGKIDKLIFDLTHRQMLACLPLGRYTNIDSFGY